MGRVRFHPPAGFLPGDGTDSKAVDFKHLVGRFGHCLMDGGPSDGQHLIGFWERGDGE